MGSIEAELKPAGYQAGAKTKGKPQGSSGVAALNRIPTNGAERAVSVGDVPRSEEGDGYKRVLGGSST